MTKVTSTLDVNIMTACNMAAGSLELKHMCKNDLVILCTSSQTVGLFPDIMHISFTRNCMKSYCKTVF